MHENDSNNTIDEYCPIDVRIGVNKVTLLFNKYFNDTKQKFEIIYSDFESCFIEAYLDSSLSVRCVIKKDNEIISNETVTILPDAQLHLINNDLLSTLHDVEETFK